MWSWWLVGWALSPLTWEQVVAVQLLWLLGSMGRKVVPRLCTPQAEKPVRGEAGWSPAHVFLKSCIHFLPSKFTGVQFYTEIVSKSWAVSPLVDLCIYCIFPKIRTLCETLCLDGHG